MTREEWQNVLVIVGENITPIKTKLYQRIGILIQKRSLYWFDAKEISTDPEASIISITKMAHDRLTKLGIDHFNLLPLNTLNSQKSIDKNLEECKAFIDRRETETYERFQSSSSSKDSQSGSTP